MSEGCATLKFSATRIEFNSEFCLLSPDSFFLNTCELRFGYIHANVEKTSSNLQLWLFLF